MFPAISGIIEVDSSWDYPLPAVDTMGQEIRLAIVNEVVDIYLASIISSSD